MRGKRTLDVEAVIEIAATFLSGARSIESLATEYQVACSTIRRALTCQGPYTTMQSYLPVARLRAMLAYKCSIKGAKLCLEDVVKIRDRYRSGATTTELAARYGVSDTHILRIVRGESHRLAGGPVYNPRR